MAPPTPIPTTPTPPTMTSASASPRRQPVMSELEWNHPYLPLGKVMSHPNIHMCTYCKLPILIYGRLIPCKHTFCSDCALKRQESGYCTQCFENVKTIEKGPVGSVFMCTHGGNKYGFDGCRKSYFSQDDLQAHFDLRHNPYPRRSSESVSEYESVGSSSRRSFNSFRSTSMGSFSSVIRNHNNFQLRLPFHNSRSHFSSFHSKGVRGGFRRRP